MFSNSTKTVAHKDLRVFFCRIFLLTLINVTPTPWIRYLCNSLPPTYYSQCTTTTRTTGTNLQPIFIDLFRQIPVFQRWQSRWFLQKLRLPMDCFSTINTTDKSVNVTVSEEYLTPDSITVKSLVDKKQLFSIKRKLVSWSDEKRLIDENGTILYRTGVNAFSKNQNMYLHDLRSDAFYTVRKKNFLPGRGRGTLLVIPGKNKHAEPMFEICSDIWRSQAIIRDSVTKDQVGSIRRNVITIKKLLTGLDFYTVRVAPASDIAFLSMLVCCYNEHYKDGIQ